MAGWDILWNHRDLGNCCAGPLGMPDGTTTRRTRTRLLSLRPSVQHNVDTLAPRTAEGVTELNFRNALVNEAAYGLVDAIVMTLEGDCGREAGGRDGR